jgi:Arylsulfotransferase (ASST)
VGRSHEREFQPVDPMRTLRRTSSLTIGRSSTRGVRASGIVSTSRHLVRGLGVAVLLTLGMALTSHVVGHGRAVPHVFIDGLKLGYFVAAGLAAATAVAAFALLPKPTGDRRRVTHGVRIAVAAAALLVSFVGTDFAVGLSQVPSIGTFTSRGAYTFFSAPGLHPPIVRAEVVQPARLASGDFFIANFYDPDNPWTMVGQSGPLILDRRLSPVWFQPVPENDLAGNLSLQTYEGRPALAWWQGHINNNAVTESGEYVIVDQRYRPVARLTAVDGWVLTLHEIVIRGADAWVTATKNVEMNLSRYGGGANGSISDSAVQEYNLKTGRLVRSWDALAHIPPGDSWAPAPANGPWDAYHVNSIDLPGDGSFVVSMRNTWAA